MSLSRQTGKIKLVENGRVYADKYSQDIVKFMNKIQLQVALSIKDWHLTIQSMQFYHLY